MSNRMNQGTLAQKLGISKNWANQLFNGRRNASFCLAKKIGQLTDTDPFIWMENNRTAERQRAFLEVKLSAWSEAA